MNAQIIKITEETIPWDEVIAIDGLGQALVGFIDEVVDGYQCESDETSLENVTHFMYIPKIKQY